MRFSEHFRLGKTQIELDFVDIPLHTDIRLFVDPYGLSIDNDPLFVECNNTVVDYFQKLIDNIRRGNDDVAIHMLSHLREPNDTRLGMSSGSPAGRGIGTTQAGELFERLSKSKAARTGKLRDLSDCELLIPNISSDKISDMTINVIRGHLVEYTQSQCRLHGVPMQRIAVGPLWNPRTSDWMNQYGDLPVYRNERLILVPKAAVRWRLAEDHHDYYQHFVLNFLQAEYFNAGTALVTTLKNGTRVVYKKDVMERHPLSKDFLLEFSEAHPEVLEAYKKSLINKADPLIDEDLEYARTDFKPPDFDRLIVELEQIQPGNAQANRYHNLILGALEAVFYPSLRNGIKEREINEGRKRVDIVFNNGDKVGFFWALSVHHKVHCPYIIIECKNYSEDAKNPEFDQLAGRLQQDRGRFGMLVVRDTKDKTTLLKRAKDFLADRKFIIVLDDSDLKALLRFRKAKDFKAINDHLQGKLDELLM